MRPRIVCALAWIATASMLTLAAPAGRAASLPNLYQLTVPLPAAPPAERRAQAIKLAMAGLLTRVTGKRDASQDPTLQPLIDGAERYVQSYGLLQGGQAQVGFIATAVTRALAELNYPVWGTERPLTLLWVAVDDGQGERALLPANDADAALPPAMTELLGDLRTQLKAVADERGLPIAFPLVDLEDLDKVSFTDVWGGFDDHVEQASARYRPDVILVGRVRPGTNGDEIDWLLLAGGTRRLVAGTALRDGLDAVADLYAAELGVVGGGSTTRITVLDVATPADYARVVSYLEGLSVLQSVDVEDLERGALSLRVTGRGDAQVLGRVLALGGVLTSSGAPQADLPANSLVFRLASNGAPP
jgi:uncharacterized protein